MDTDSQPVNQDEIKKEDPSDKLTPEHPRFKDVLNRAKIAEEKTAILEQQMADLQRQISERQERTGEEEFTQEEIAAYNKIQKLNKQAGFVTKEEIENERKIEKAAAQMTELEKVHDGSDGLPKFDSVEVQLHAKRYGISDLEKAYNDLHYEARVQHELKHRNNVQVPQSEKPAGGGERQIGNTKLTGKDIENMTDAEYEQNREKILNGMKPSR